VPFILPPVAWTGGDGLTIAQHRPGREQRQCWIATRAFIFPADAHRLAPGRRVGGVVFLESDMSQTHKVVCPNCHTTNAIPSDKLAGGPRCGKCKQDIFNAHPVELQQSSFQRHVRYNDIPLLVDFWAPWCGPCRAMAPAFEQAAVQLGPNVRLAKLNTDDEQAIGAEYGIRSIPTMVLFRNGHEIARQSGAMMAGDIVRWTRAQLG